MSRLTVLWLTEAQAHQIASHARDEAPNEACGLIAGRGRQAVKVIPVPNTAADPVHHYEMDKTALSRYLPQFASEGLELIGIYHSHPRGDTIPSSEDIRNAFYPNTAYIIVGLKGREPLLAAWVMEYGSVQSLALHIGQLPPTSDTVNEEPLSSTQKTAIILSAVMAFVLLILLSLSLLPPAPPIPN